MESKFKFIEKSNIKYNNKFDYSKFEYVNAKTKSIIVCPIHGEFLQNPDKHLTSKFGCPTCAKELKTYVDRTGKPNIKSRITKDWFANKFYEKYGRYYSIVLDDFNGITGNKIQVICPVHGVSLFYPNSIRIVKCPCNECSNLMRIKNKTEPYVHVLEQFNRIYGSKYTYPDENKLSYKNKRSKIKIICPIHGEYIKSAQKHLSGQECFQCTIDNLIKIGKLSGGYSDNYFKNNPSKINELSTLYYIKVGKLFKIGITTNLNNRIKSIKSESRKNVDIILKKEYTLYDSFKIEQTILELFNNFRTYRRWSTELFEVDIQENIKHYFIGE